MTYVSPAAVADIDPGGATGMSPDRIMLRPHRGGYPVADMALADIRDAGRC